MKKLVILLALSFTQINLFADDSVTPTLLSSLAAPVAATDNQLNYYYRGESLKKSLEMYARNLGLSIQFSSDIVPSKLATSVTGHFAVASGEDLLNILAKQYGFNWFIYSGTLYITSNHLISQSIEVAPDDLPMIRSSLQRLGLLDSRFGYSELPAENRIIISGPKPYVNLLIEQIKNFNIAPMSQQFAVFHLKYANATDLQFTFNNQQITVPGVATILQAILQGNANASAGANRLVSQVIQPIQNQVNQELAKRQESGATDNSNGGVVSAPIIEADSRLNTILIRDKAANLKIYRDLIELLDVPAPLIQVEVLVIRLDQDKLEQQGVNWWGSYNGYGAGFGAANLVTGTPSSNLSFYYGQINPGQLLVNNVNNFMSSLQFLEQKSIAQAVARPSLATTDNLPAIMNVSENLYLNVPQQNGGAATAGSNNNTGYYMQQQVNTALEITPHLIFTNDNQKEIKLSIVLQDGTIRDQTINMMPTTVQSTINSQAVIKEGQSILLAGFTKDVNEKVTTSVPFLGSIPVLGWLFKSTSTEQHRVATLYLVTPKVIWLGDMYKLKDYVMVGGKNFDIKNSYQIVPTDESTAVRESAIQVIKPKQ